MTNSAIIQNTISETPRHANDSSTTSLEACDFDLDLAAGAAEKHYWIDLWRYRELFFILAWRDISVRYKQTSIGIIWALLQPFLTMLVMTIVFGKVAGLRSEGGAPYAIMVFAAMLPWMFFSSSLSSSSQSLVANGNLISKVYFPRMIVPASSVVTCCADFLISFTLLVGMMFYYGFAPSWRILVLPGLVLFAVLAALGPGLLLTALIVKYRDFRYVVPFMVQFGLYISPVGFSSSVIHEKIGDGLFFLYCLNPVVSIIDGFRWAILGGASSIYLPGFVLSLSITLVFLAVGIWYFRKTERAFVDII